MDVCWLSHHLQQAVAQDATNVPNSFAEEHTHTHAIVLLLFWNLSGTMHPGEKAPER